MRAVTSTTPSFASHSRTLSMMSFPGETVVALKTLGTTIPGLLMAIVGLISPARVASIALAALLPVSPESTWGLLW